MTFRSRWKRSPDGRWLAVVTVTVAVALLGWFAQTRAAAPLKVGGLPVT